MRIDEQTALIEGVDTKILDWYSRELDQRAQNWLMYLRYVDLFSVKGIEEAYGNSSIPDQSVQELREQSFIERDNSFL